MNGYLEEQLLAAWRQRQELRHGGGTPKAEYVDVRNPDHWVCRCGNCPCGDGFKRVGGHVGVGGFVHAHVQCRRCQRVIVGPHGYVTEGCDGK